VILRFYVFLNTLAGTIAIRTAQDGATLLFHGPFHDCVPITVNPDARKIVRDRSTASWLLYPPVKNDGCRARRDSQRGNKFWLYSLPQHPSAAPANLLLRTQPFTTALSHPANQRPRARVAALGGDEERFNSRFNPSKQSRRGILWRMPLSGPRKVVSSHSRSPTVQAFTP
jgi:hypothetical protein